MGVRSLMLSLAAASLLAWQPTLSAGDGSQSRQATLRLSLTLVDSCEIATHPAPQVTQPPLPTVSCSGSTPHNVTFNSPTSGNIASPGLLNVTRLDAASGGSEDVKQALTVITF